MTPTPPAFDLEAFRRLALAQPEARVTRVIAVVLSIVLLASVLHLVRRGKLREEYTPIWVGVAGALFLASVWFDGVRMLTRAIGAWTPSSTLFFFGLLFVMALGLNYAVRLSALSRQVQSLAQEAALLRAALDEVREDARTDHDEGGPGTPA
jgi:hypothetical protein